VKVIDAGVALDPDAFWINLVPNAFAGDPRAAWIQRDELRQAISLAVDRQAFVDSLFLGAAVPVWGPVTPANKVWYVDSLPHPAHDPATARRLLASIGLTDPDGDGQLTDSSGRPARFTLLTAMGQTALERGAAIIRDELAKVGLGVDVVGLEANALVQRFVSGKGYDAVFFHLSTTSTDPAVSADFWLSGGGAHVWNFGPSARPAEWEKEIDRLMAAQMASPDQAERQRTFTAVQQTFAAHLPMIHFAAPRVFVATSSRLANLSPAITRPQLLWSADTIQVTR
jgi:peptide/nickel transport system substrate-binding protein